MNVCSGGPSIYRVFADCLNFVLLLCLVLDCLLVFVRSCYVLVPDLACYIAFDFWMPQGTSLLIPCLAGHS